MQYFICHNSDQQYICGRISGFSIKFHWIEFFSIVAPNHTLPITIGLLQVFAIALEQVLFSGSVSIQTLFFKKNLSILG